MWNRSSAHIKQLYSGSVGSLQTSELICSQSLEQKKARFKNYSEGGSEIEALNTPNSHLSSWLMFNWSEGWFERSGPV